MWKRALTWISITAATVAIVAGCAFALFKSGVLRSEKTESPAPVAAASHYIVFLPQLEVEALTARGHDWDMTGGGPDVRYDVWWRGTRIFQSSVRNDTLLARWDQEEIGIKDIVRGVSAESSVKAARITIQPGEKLEFRVFDTDPMSDDEIGRWEVAVESLHSGDQTWDRPAPLVRQAVCRVVRIDPSGR